MRLLTVILALALFPFTFFPITSQAAVDPSASVVKLRTSCQVGGSTIANCFTDLNTLNTWIWNTRTPTPSASSPLTVDIGPGTFTGQFTCNNAGYVSLNGSGVGVTVIQNGSEPIATTACQDMAYSNFTVKNTGNLFGVAELGGSSVWNNAEIDGIGYAWFDSPTTSCGAAPGTHYFYASRIIAHSAANSATAYFNACDTSWLIGSQIQAIGSSGSEVRPIIAIGGQVHVYGGNIEALTDGDVTVSSMVAASASGAKTQVHIHGTGIDVISGAPNNIVALSASNGGLVHAVADGYFMQTGTGGTTTRMVNSGGTVMAPYAWPSSANPPAIVTGNAAENGEDTAVITSTSDGHPHQLIYDSTCSSGWYDSTARVCH